MIKVSKIIVILVAVMVIATPVFAASLPNQWPSAGNNLSNTRYQDNTSLKAQKVGNLQVQWQFTTGGDVSATHFSVYVL